MSRVWWKCERCGLELSFDEVVQSGGHDCGGAEGCTNRFVGQVGKCSRCFEGTEILDPCCGYSVWFEGDRVHGIDAYHACGCAKCMAACLATGCLECDEKAKVIA